MSLILQGKQLAASAVLTEHREIMASDVKAYKEVGEGATYKAYALSASPSSAVSPHLSLSP